MIEKRKFTGLQKLKGAKSETLNKRETILNGNSLVSNFPKWTNLLSIFTLYRNYVKVLIIDIVKALNRNYLLL